MKLSIAMCTYNGALYLPEQLDSILAQIRLPDEMVICDDRSSDQTMEIIEAFAARAPFPVRFYLNEKNLGSTKNFEKAITLCAGDIIALSDQDDVWHPEKLLRMEAVFSSVPDVGCIFTDAELVDKKLRPLNRLLSQSNKFNQLKQRRFEQGEAFNVLLAHNVVCGATMAFRARYRELVLPIPEYVFYLHDGWITLLIACVADVVFIREPLIKYRQHSEQQVGAGIKRSIRDWYAAARRGHPSAVELRAMCELRKLLTGRSDVRDREPMLARLEVKIAHLQMRENLPANRMGRLPYVLKDLLTFRYHHYSTGLAGAVKDLLS